MMPVFYIQRRALKNWLFFQIYYEGSVDEWVVQSRIIEYHEITLLKKNACR
jgi:hypothetical protein